MFAKAIKRNETNENAPQSLHSIAIEFAPDSNQFNEPEEELEVVCEANPKTINLELKVKENYKAPAQTELKSRLALINSDLVGLMERERRKLLSTEQEKELDQLKQREEKYREKTF